MSKIHSSVPFKESGKVTLNQFKYDTKRSDEQSKIQSSYSSTCIGSFPKDTHQKHRRNRRSDVRLNTLEILIQDSPSDFLHNGNPKHSKYHHDTGRPFTYLYQPFF